ncbi:DUF971 domain-containing protein [Roseobacter sp. HKCCD9010]|uniref:TauD/TfdA family dioxygenase n=1 Tax=unclassified Roseobacter TaxID=196798 RepID=UPI001490DF45|nr:MULTISPECIES: TauD/TfdA family dioxygenase [unclassified Roseobacter]MBF9052282.1 DUF971 domain-containing protein [Rhodobacterales bacterium HKCCD4356]NNV14198.1 DUF971 domain-containing protein [Roseobacter sp. HKCCD7357]NNV18442.1 DUF971 domain-containing protein [Roseobacter sp. HKCCD8768]NNV27861.1 DUF971 domain-containing protein [Roseobacter sp. HKCCD8192]NNV32127.1 DUF971 domain-containing protein [Roseobacter sp. HKCCD9061]
MSNLVDADFRNYRTSQRIEKLEHTKDAVTLTWSDGHVGHYDQQWLFDNCRCPLCVHPETLEPLVQFIDKHVPGIGEILTTLDALKITWADGHLSQYSNGWLRSYDASLDANRVPTFEERFDLWDATSLAVPEFQYADTHSTGEMGRLLETLINTGFVIVKNAPRDDGFAVDFAKRIGDLRVTAFGRYFDVIAKNEPNSNGYTSFALPPHTDIAHYEAPPAIQLQHFLENDAKGGLSTLVDGFKLARVLAERKPQVFQQLIKPVYTFRFQDDALEHAFQGPIIALDPDGNPKSVRLDLDILEPFMGSVDEVRKCRSAVKTFCAYCMNDEFQFTKKLDAGDLMIVSNTRLLHGRTAFEPSTGKRRLQVCYLDRGEVSSRMQVLNRSTPGSRGQVYDDAGRFLMCTTT